MNERPFQFEWDEVRADANTRKHGITFELASTLFFDPNLLTVADVEHSETEERWFLSALPARAYSLSVVYLWFDADPGAIKIRLISARSATQAECRQYEQNL